MKPKRGDAIMFHSLGPDGKSHDKHALHTACPVITGVKYVGEWTGGAGERVPVQGLILQCWSAWAEAAQRQLQQRFAGGSLLPHPRIPSASARSLHRMHAPPPPTPHTSTPYLQPSFGSTPRSSAPSSWQHPRRRRWSRLNRTSAVTPMSAVPSGRPRASAARTRASCGAAPLGWAPAARPAATAG